MNGIWRLPAGFTISGAYFFGSGNYYSTTYAANPFGHTGVTRYVTAPLTVNPAAADRFDGPTTFAVGSVIPRNALKGFPLHRIDRPRVEGAGAPGRRAESPASRRCSTCFNHENYGAYNAQVNSPTFGDPRQNLLNAYQPRVAQLAFKVELLGAVRDSPYWGAAALTLALATAARARGGRRPRPREPRPVRQRSQVASLKRCT